MTAKQASIRNALATTAILGQAPRTDLVSIHGFPLRARIGRSVAPLVLRSYAVAGVVNTHGRTGS